MVQGGAETSTRETQDRWPRLIMLTTSWSPRHSPSSPYDHRASRIKLRCSQPLANRSLHFQCPLVDMCAINK
jgi:hypothetical protein